MLHKPRQGITINGSPLAKSSLKRSRARSQEKVIRLNEKECPNLVVRLAKNSKSLKHEDKNIEKTIPKNEGLLSKFKNLFDYRTSQSTTSQSLVLSKKKGKASKRTHTQIKKSERPIYAYDVQHLKQLKSKEGCRKYYEGRIILRNKNEKNYQLFRVFTDNDLGINRKIQGTIQEACIDDDCQTDDEQIKMAIRKSKNEVIDSLKTENRKKLMDKIFQNNKNDWKLKLDENPSSQSYYSSTDYSQYSLQISSQTH